MTWEHISAPLTRALANSARRYEMENTLPTDLHDETIPGMLEVAGKAANSKDWGRLTNITHSKSYGDGSACAGWIQKNGQVFVHCAGWFGNTPYHFNVEQARAMSVVLAGIVAEHDEYQARLTAEYGPIAAEATQ